MELFMIKFNLDLEVLFHWSARVSRIGNSVDYSVHAAMRQIFGSLGLQPFFIDQKRSCVIAYTTATEEQFRSAWKDAYAREQHNCVNVCEALKMDSASCMGKMPSAWREGDTFLFSVRCKPIMRVSVPVTKPSKKISKTLESDVWLHRTYQKWKKEYPEEEDQENHPLNEYRKAHIKERDPLYFKWLEDHFGDAAKLEYAEITRQLNTALVLRGNSEHTGAPKKSTDRNSPDVTFEGRLRVMNSQKFAELLAHGIGRHKAFGFGMLLLRAER